MQSDMELHRPGLLCCGPGVGGHRLCGGVVAGLVAMSCSCQPLSVVEGPHDSYTVT